MKRATLRESERRFVAERRVGHLATVDVAGRPQVVPICFALLDDIIVSALDEKPKSVPPTELRRVRNLLARPAVEFLVDEYDDDWERLRFVQLRGRASLIDPGDPCHAAAVQILRIKYPQYGSMRIQNQPIIRIVIEGVHVWSARPNGFVV